ncbi:unnamed protein product [Ilex paraguariensis]|uniref:B box-type domain-containing protein n=1 Tax=Ilex paraguariensis TaxID=185542 RepID=A0ABC8RM69_9AQUA
MKDRVCELCSGEAALYCSSDSAFLCWNCDTKVHEHNFLVARHFRRTICSVCKNFAGDRISGVGIRPYRAICQSCLPDSPGDELESSYSSSVCISSTESCATPPKKIKFDSKVSGEHLKASVRFSGEVTSGTTMKSEVTTKVIRSRRQSNVDSKAEGIFGTWCRKLGLGGDVDVVKMSSDAFGVFSEKLTVLPFRVRLAASLWFCLKLCGDRSASTWQVLKRLEEISGVPAKLILAAESKLARVLKVRKPRRHEEEEGWAECST